MTRTRQDHRIRWGILFDGEIQAAIDCYAEPGALCREGQTCNASQRLPGQGVMGSYRPAAGSGITKPRDGPVEVWWDPIEPGWCWKYPRDGYWWDSTEPPGVET
jgi:hypothetical protein